MKSSLFLLCLVATSFFCELRGMPSPGLRRRGATEDGRFGAGAATAAAGPSDPIGRRGHQLRYTHNASAYASEAESAAGQAGQALEDMQAIQRQLRALQAQVEADARVVERASRQASESAELIQNITPVIIGIGFYCLATSLIIAPRMKKDYQEVKRRIMMQADRMKRMYRRMRRRAIARSALMLRGK